MNNIELKVDVVSGSGSLNKWLVYFTAILAVLIGLWSNQALAGSKITYYHNNNLGSPIAATDNNGTVLWREDYRPFGQRLLNEPGSEENNRWHTGKPEDNFVGFDYSQARWYDPVVGRFIGMDPVYNPQDPSSFNRYSYVSNNPFRYIDLTGEIKIDVEDAQRYPVLVNAVKGAEKLMMTKRGVNTFMNVTGKHPVNLVGTDKGPTLHVKDLTAYDDNDGEVAGIYFNQDDPNNIYVDLRLVKSAESGNSQSQFVLEATVSHETGHYAAFKMEKPQNASGERGYAIERGIYGKQADQITGSPQFPYVKDK